MARPVDTKLVFYRISAFFIIIDASLSLPAHALIIPHLLTIEVQRLHPNHSEELQQKPIGGLFLQLEWINNWSRSHVRFLLNCICYVYKEAVKWIGTRACYIFKARRENMEGNCRLRSKMGRRDWKKKFEVFLDWGPGLNAFVLLTLPLSGSDFEAFNAG